MDNTIIRALRYLHSSTPESQDNLRMLLEESLKNKYGQGKEIGPLLNVPVKLDYSTSINTSNQIDLSKDDSKNATSDNELELDLLKEDLMCIVCNGMGVGARNRLVECGDCHNLYHQECHNPSITEDEIESSVSWICVSCKEIGSSHKKVGLSSSSSTKSSASINPVPATTSSSSSSRKFSEQEGSEVPQSFSSGKSSSSKSSSSSSSSSNRLLTPNINIISADKRLQIMKKKAAKMQEKRKLSRP